ncbi:predicted protein [Uncinocarpus reesii 1704]|uniref:chitinase n=1 Tax=Uncinocarpus reesii (strain UAMH 1704) TaxID=336963 RepID=C4JK98_UNCRE|nr:uncharacterized protein UREG_02055 [Uncinocarpus reesii 1704]EEP77206.1 predicted protein [Uncinocarpus reesii 1704]
MTLVPESDIDLGLFKAFTGLKKRKPSLKTFISVGGWDAGGRIFTTMAHRASYRKAFIKSAVKLMDKYGFDGIDIDWEYPVAWERGYLKGFDIQRLERYVDWFNFMSYDIHEIEAGLDLLWRNGVDPGVVSLGLGFYGRSFTLKDPGCNQPGCAFIRRGRASGGAKAGECTGQSGVLSNYEINRILKSKSLTPASDQEAAVKWISWDSDQWVSYDDAETLRRKGEFANARCLGGTFAWALDLGGPGTLGRPETLNGSDLEGANPDGSDSGSGDVFISPNIFTESEPNIACVAPCTFILPPIPLGSSTTISFPPYSTSLEVAWPTTITITLPGGAVSTSTGLGRTILNTTLTIPPVTTTVIEVWNWILTDIEVTSTSHKITSSILPPPFVITDNQTVITVTRPVESTSGTTSTTDVVPPVTVITRPVTTRTITPPPFPWWSVNPVESPLPTLTYTQGPPSPLCEGDDCGKKCKKFCKEPCRYDCKDGDDFLDQNDRDRDRDVERRRCEGPDCSNGECAGIFCVTFGCIGFDCVDGICLGPLCKITTCTGSDCRKGRCIGPKCRTGSGCAGDDCSSNGRCIGPKCISFGCIGADCKPCSGSSCSGGWECTGPRCKIVTCKGSSCRNGLCSGSGCEPGNDGCDEAQTARRCTEMVSKVRPPKETTYSTTTSTICSTITACDAQPTTVTTTYSRDGIKTQRREVITYKKYKENPAQAACMKKALQIRRDNLSKLMFEPQNTPTTTRKRPEPTGPVEQKYSCKGSIRCKSAIKLGSDCQMAKAALVENTLYGNTPRCVSGGTCYAAPERSFMGCGVMVQGPEGKCELTGNQIAA